MIRVFGSSRGGRIALAVTIVSLAATCASPPLAAAPTPYQLYYAFEIPRALQGFVIGPDGSQPTYTGTLRGTLGGLPLREAAYSYLAGASKAAGGGTCSLATAAGTIRDGQILMTTEGKRITLLCFGMYLGTRIAITIITEGEPIGGIGVTASGLASTGFYTHEEYMTAVRTAATALPAETRSQVVAQAETNPRLVSEYQQKLTPR